MKMKPGYYLVMDNGGLYGPIVCDNPLKDTYFDASVLEKTTKWGAILGQEWKVIPKE